MRCLIGIAFWLSSSVGAQADIDRLMRALQFETVIETLVTEEREHGAALADGFFPDQPMEGWQDRVDAIHSVERAHNVLRREMAVVFGNHDLSLMIDYFESDAAQTILTLESSARAAFSDPALVQAIQDDLEGLANARPDLFAAVTRYIGYSNLIDQNVAAAHLSNVAFAAGLIDGGQFSGLTPERLASEMWDGLEASRTDTELWLQAFFMTAYGPADPVDLAFYIDSALTPDGEILNQAINRGFERLYAETSFEMGQAVAEFMGGDEI